MDHEAIRAEAMARDPREYKDVDGKRILLDTLCKRQPEWAANNIRRLEAEVGGMKRQLQDHLQLIERNRVAHEAEVAKLLDSRGFWRKACEDYEYEVAELKKQIERFEQCEEIAVEELTRLRGILRLRGLLEE